MWCIVHYASLTCYSIHICTHRMIVPTRWQLWENCWWPLYGWSSFLIIASCFSHQLVPEKAIDPKKTKVIGLANLLFLIKDLAPRKITFLIITSYFSHQLVPEEAILFFSSISSRRSHRPQENQSQWLSQPPLSNQGPSTQACIYKISFLIITPCFSHQLVPEKAIDPKKTKANGLANLPWLIKDLAPTHN